jgi:uncharacterized RDD family membrane protein YckC
MAEGQRVGIGPRFGALLLDLVILLVLVVIGTTIVASVGGIRLGLRYQELLGGRVSISRVVDGSLGTYVEERTEKIADRLVRRAAEDFSPAALEQMGSIMADELIRQFDPRWSRLRYYLNVDEQTLPSAVDEAFDAVVAREDPQLPAEKVNALRDEVQTAVRELRLDEFLPAVVSFAVLIAATPFVLVVLYFLVEAFTGASFGKMALGLIVALPTGERAYMGTYFYRFVVKYSGPLLLVAGLVTRSYTLIAIGGFVWAVILLGYVTALSPDRRCLHDYLTGTAVLRRADVR